MSGLTDAFQGDVFAGVEEVGGVEEVEGELHHGFGVTHEAALPPGSWRGLGLFLSAVMVE